MTRSRAPSLEASDWTAGGMLLFGVWLGLLVGVVETTALLAQQHLAHRIINRPRELIWMAPVGYAAIFTVLGLGAALLSRLFRRRALEALPLFLLLLSAIGSLALFPTLRRIHIAALALVSVGLAARLAPAVARRPDAVGRLVRRTGPFVAAAIALASVLTAAGRARAERMALEGASPAPPGAPNVLLLILDTVAATHTSVHGYDRPTTPALERIAAEGAGFDRALSTSPWTLPSHASMFTGRYPHELSASWLAPLGPEPETLAEHLGGIGYATAGFVANRPYGTYEHGLDRGFARYEDYRLSPGQIFRSTVLGRYIADLRHLRGWIGTDRQLGRKDARLLVSRFLDWLDDSPEGPFFAFMNFYDAHDPYLPPREHFERFAGHPRERQMSPFRRYAADRLASDISAAEVQEEIDAYDGAISYIDEQIGRLLDGLRERGVADRTVVIVTADHGEEFGEHGVFLHGHSLYLPSLHVPLVIRYPDRVPSGTRVGDPVTLRDVAATVLDMVGTCDGGFPGRSLAIHWGETECGSTTPSPLLASVRRGVRVPAAFPTARGDMYSVFDSTDRVISNGDGVEEVYGWIADPLESVDLAGTPEGRDAIARLRPLLPARALAPGPGRER